MLFRDRADAGRQLAYLLSEYAGRTDVVVLGLPRGGVAVADEIARLLDAPLDVFLARKLGVPGHEELAFGAVALPDVRVINDDVVQQVQLLPEVIEEVAARERALLEAHHALYRAARPPPELRERIAILVDDGLATGATMRAAVQAVRAQQPLLIMVAVPVGAPTACAALHNEADRVICAAMPDPFRAVGWWYEDFHQTDDAEVQRILHAAMQRA